jgi:hypothetical protein
LSIRKIANCGASKTDGSSNVPTFTTTVPGSAGDLARMWVPARQT